jgi:hypothetical protein
VAVGKLGKMYPGSCCPSRAEVTPMDDSIVELIDIEEQIFRARLAGKSVRRIAHEHHMSIANIQSIIEKNTIVVDNRLRLATLALELERLDELQKPFYVAALNGDVQAAAILLKVQERRASYLALDCGTRVDPRPLPNEETNPSQGSTVELLNRLNEIARERTAPALLLVGGTDSAASEHDLDPADPNCPKNDRPSPSSDA